MNAWSREDIVVAYALYCVTPLKQINPRNRTIQQVAEIIPHSVASVVMRMRNFQYLDPQAGSGLRNVAKADKLIYEEFKHDWGALSLEAETLTGLVHYGSWARLAGASLLQAGSPCGVQRPVLYIRLRTAANADRQPYQALLKVQERGGPRES